VHRTKGLWPAVVAARDPLHGSCGLCSDTLFPVDSRKANKVACNSCVTNSNTTGAGQKPKDVQDPEVLHISGFEDIIALMVHLLLLVVTIP